MWLLVQMAKFNALKFDIYRIKERTKAELQLLQCRWYRMQSPLQPDLLLYTGRTFKALLIYSTS